MTYGPIAPGPRALACYRESEAGLHPPSHLGFTLMASLKQIEANRLNAQKSTGPRTSEGKAVSRFNALKAGIDASAEAIPGEDPEELRALAAEYYQRFTPDRPEHYALVDALISSDWLLRRLRKIEAQLWRRELAETRTPTNAPLARALIQVEDSLARLQRRIDSADRAYHRAINQIRRLQQTPLTQFDHEPLDETPEAASPQPIENTEPTPTIGFVPQKSPPPEAPSASRAPARNPMPGWAGGFACPSPGVVQLPPAA
jgi:hypothetical protein